MLIVIPVSKSDEQMMDPTTELITKLGGCFNHDVLVVGSIDCELLVNKLVGDLRPQFRSASAYLFPCAVTGWPLGPNAYFRSTVSYLCYESGNTQPWYWFELDNTPLKSGWADTLQHAYNETGAVFMGAKHPTFYSDSGGKLIIKGHHMAGTGIYPSNFTDHSTLWKFEEGIAFDVWIQWEVIKGGLTDTPLIQHNWKTLNYRFEDGSVVCDNTLPLPHPDLRFNHPLREDAVILHGCKDNSLTELILNSLSGKTAEIDSPEVPEPVKPTKRKAASSGDRRKKKFKNNWNQE